MIQTNPINRAIAETRFAMTKRNLWRWNAAPADAQFAELHIHPFWIDLCFWNGKEWQYVTSRRSRIMRDRRKHLPIYDNTNS